MFFLLFLVDDRRIRISISDLWIWIREAQNLRILRIRIRIRNTELYSLDCVDSVSSVLLACLRQWGLQGEVLLLPHLLQLDFKPIPVHSRFFLSQLVRSFCLFIRMENDFEDSFHFGPRYLLLKSNWIWSLHLRMVRICIRYIPKYCTVAAKNPYFFFYIYHLQKGTIWLQFSLEKHVLLLIQAKNLQLFSGQQRFS